MLPEWSTYNTVSRKYDDRFGCNGNADDIRRSTNQSCAATDVSAKGKCPCRTDRSAPEVAARLLMIGIIVKPKMDIINDRACYSGDPDNNNYNKGDISATDRMNKGCDQFENTGFFQTANDHK